VSSSAPGTPAPVTGPGAPPADGFVISGYAYSHDGVARLLSRMSVLPDLDNVQLSSSSMTPLGTRNIVSFSISAAIVTHTGGQS
jgi:hypothetical protein